MNITENNIENELQSLNDDDWTKDIIDLLWAIGMALDLAKGLSMFIVLAMLSE